MNIKPLESISANPPEVSEEAIILAKLCAMAPSIEIRDCLRSYSPSKPFKHLTSTFNAYSKNIIAGTLNYLGLKNLVKAECVKKLIYRVQALLPEDCSICKQHYPIDKNDDLLLSCYVCGQEVHKECLLPILSLPNSPSLLTDFIERIPGLLYLCSSCEDSYLPSKDEGQKKSFKTPITHQVENTNTAKQNAIENGAIANNIPYHDNLKSSNRGRNPDDDMPLLSVNNTNLLPKIELQRTLPSHSTEYLNTRPLKEAKKENKPDYNSMLQPIERNKASSKQDNLSVKSKSKVCKDYYNNKCKYGISGSGCKFSHPKRCQKLKKFGNKGPKGCNLGGKCQHFHPRMCADSVSKGECFYEKCPHCHVKGTKRIKREKKPTEQIQSPTYQVTDNIPVSDTPKHGSSFLDLSLIEILKAELKNFIELKINALTLRANPYSTNQDTTRTTNQIHSNHQHQQNQQQIYCRQTQKPHDHLWNHQQQPTHHPANQYMKAAQNHWINSTHPIQTHLTNPVYC